MSSLDFRDHDAMRLPMLLTDRMKRQCLKNNVTIFPKNGKHFSASTNSFFGQLFMVHLGGWCNPQSCWKLALIMFSILPAAL